uniref:C-type lectin domain-containing protein n=1 Tax=Magallana gigas TaxID=29159 RepID=A0A8W8JF97_MAGGI
MCNRLGGSSLVEIESAEENNFLKSHIRNTLHREIDDRQIKSSFWIGGTDFIVEGQWVWISTQKNLTYSDWGHH